MTEDLPDTGIFTGETLVDELAADCSVLASNYFGQSLNSRGRAPTPTNSLPGQPNRRSSPSCRSTARRSAS